MTPDLADRLRKVYWIGGGSGAGKSTIARTLADRYGLRVYSTDEAMTDHTRRRTPGRTPYLDGFARMDMDERWLNRTPSTMLETFHWYRGEGFDPIVEDLLALPAGTSVVAEGFRLLPGLVQPLLADPDHAVWLLPTPQRRVSAFESRGDTWTIAGRTSDAPRARTQLLERDAMFTDRLARQIQRLGLHAIRIDVGTSADDVAAQVARSFGFEPSPGRTPGR